jgi:serine/threonine-protein kinase
MLAPGFHPLPGYCLTERLGAGAFGEVWKAEGDGGQTAALKFIDCASKPTAELAAEMRTLRALSALRHPNLIHLRAVHATSHYLVLEMELADGSLDDLHRAYRQTMDRNVPAGQALALLGQVARGLDFLTQIELPGVGSRTQALQHANLKPSNLLLVGETAKIGDFGLATVTTAPSRGRWRGTPPYAAPELDRGLPCAGTDQYALAVIFCELVAGDRLFRHVPGENGPPVQTIDLARLVEGNRLFRLDSASNSPPVPPGPPVDLTKAREREYPVLSRAMHPHAGSRYPSCQAFVAALREVVKAPRGRKYIRKVSRGSTPHGRSPAEIAARLREMQNKG